MADQIPTLIHPVCQPVLDRITAMMQTVRTLQLLAETEDEHDARRAAKYLETAVIMAAEDISAMTRQEAANA